MTGRGGDTVIWDDPIKAQDAHYDARRERVNGILKVLSSLAWTTGERLGSQLMQRCT